jgi:hypothetical protein
VSASRSPGIARTLVGAVGLIVLLSACSIPSRPVWWPKPKPSDSTHLEAAPSKSQPTVVADPWRPGMRQLGIQVYWTANKVDPAAVIQAKAQRIIAYAIGLKANSIAVTFPFYTYGITSNVLYRTAETPSPADIAVFLAQAAKDRIRVTLRPILNETALVAQNPIAWRGTISPTDLHAWFASYHRLLIPYAKVAQAGGAASFVIGTEFDSLEGDRNWGSLVQSIKSVYHGELIYDENFTQFAAHDTNLPVATFGVDAYPRFSLSDSASVGQLTRAWDGWLGAHSLAVRRRAILSEVGIDAVPGSYSDPGAWLTTTTSPIDVRVQAKWYEAVCRAVGAEQIGGVYWWEVSFDADPAHPSQFLSDRLTFLARPAQAVIRSCFGSLASQGPK